MREVIYTDLPVEKLREMAGEERLRLNLERTELWRNEQLEVLRLQNSNANEGYIQHLFLLRML